MSNATVNPKQEANLAYLKLRHAFLGSAAAAACSSSTYCTAATVTDAVSPRDLRSNKSVDDNKNDDALEQEKSQGVGNLFSPRKRQRTGQRTAAASAAATNSTRSSTSSSSTSCSARTGRTAPTSGPTIRISDATARARFSPESSPSTWSESKSNSILEYETVTKEKPEYPLPSPVTETKEFVHVFVDEHPTLDDAVAAALLKSLNKAPTIGMNSKSTRSTTFTATKSSASTTTSTTMSTATTSTPALISVDDNNAPTDPPAPLWDPIFMTRTPSHRMQLILPAPTAEEPLDYRDEDVLLGKGGLSNNHPGNKAYVAKALSMQDDYKFASTNEKTKMSQVLVQFVHERGGRFMVKPSKASALPQQQQQQQLQQQPICGERWIAVDYTTARKKASRLLRGDARRNPEDGTYAVKPVGAVKQRHQNNNNSSGNSSATSSICSGHSSRRVTAKELLLQNPPGVVGVESGVSNENVVTVEFGMFQRSLPHFG